MPSAYVRPEMLAETEWLAEHLGDPSIVILDCDETPGYARLHIKGAVGLRVHHYLKGVPSLHLMPPDKFEQTMSKHGIDGDKTVVVYDSMGGVYAARLWWALDYYGHSDVKLLNGGFRKWYTEGRPVTFDRTHVEPADFKVAPGSDTLCMIDDVRAAIDRDDTIIWDLRSKSEHTGAAPRQNKHAGHIPGAVHMEWLDTTVPPAPSGLLLPPDDLRAKFETLGINPEMTILTH